MKKERSFRKKKQRSFLVRRKGMSGGVVTRYKNILSQPLYNWLLQVPQQIVYMRSSFHVPVFFHQYAFFINDERGALDAHVFFPYMLFSFMTPYKLHTVSFSSERRGKLSSYLSRKLQCFFTLSRLTPSTEYPRFLNSSRLARNACASSVHPEVLSFG